MTQWNGYRTWTYSPLEGAMADPMAEEVLQEIETYFSRFQKTVAQNIETRPIMDLRMV